MEEINRGLRQLFGRWHRELVPTTKALRDFVERDTPKAILEAPSRMIDSVDDMLNSYRRKDIDKAPGTSAHLPVTFFAVARDMLPALDWASRPQAEGTMVILPNDPKQRVFELRLWSGEVRAQVVHMAPDEPTSQSMAMQFSLFMSRFKQRSFELPFQFAGVPIPWPVMIETPDFFTNHTPNEQKNLVIRAQDMTLRLSIPFLRGPAAGEPSDELGTPGDPNDPSGFPRVQRITVETLRGPLVPLE